MLQRALHGCPRELQPSCSGSFNGRVGAHGAAPRLARLSRAARWLPACCLGLPSPMKPNPPVTKMFFPASDILADP
jgi:hypothetical protein